MTGRVMSFLDERLRSEDVRFSAERIQAASGPAG